MRVGVRGGDGERMRSSGGSGRLGCLNWAGRDSAVLRCVLRGGERRKGFKVKGREVDRSSASLLARDYDVNGSFAHLH